MADALDDTKTVELEQSGSTSTARRRSASKVTDLTGVVLGGEYTLEEEIGRGAFGVVYRATQASLRRSAAVKVLAAKRAELGTIRRFLSEANLSAQFTHPYAAHVYDFGADSRGILWLAMELVRGETLRNHIRAHGPMGLAAAIQLIEQLADVIDGAHALGILHRDIKASNVMLVRSHGRSWPKLLDFGIAKHLGALGATIEDSGDSAPIAPADHPEETAVGARVGTPTYMAPELWERATNASRQSDIYALGVLAHVILTGAPPFIFSDPGLLKAAHERTGLPPLPDHLPQSLAAVLTKAMAKRPEDRFATATDFAFELARAADSQGSVRDAWQVVFDAWRDAPQPLADALLRLSRDPGGAAALAGVRDALGGYLLTIQLAAAASGPAALVGVVAGHIAEHRGDGPLPKLALAVAIARAMLRLEAKAPVPELCRVLAELDDETIATLDTSSFGSSAHAERLRQLLRDLLPLSECGIAERVDGEVRWWGGAQASTRPSAVVKDGGAGDEACFVLVDRHGAAALDLGPLVQAREPAPHQPPCLFFWAGDAASAHRLDSPPFYFLAESRELAAWLEQRFGVVAAGRDERSDDNPFRGLAPYGQEDAGLFYGRSEETTTAINRLRSEPMLAVVGPSGAGKSSLVNAGILPGLADWDVVRLRPGNRPLDSLVHAFGGSDSGPLAELARGGSPELAARRVRGEVSASGGRLLVVVDQLEELFVLCADRAERERFARFLTNVATSYLDPVRVLYTLRDDFLATAESLPALHSRVSGSLQFLTTPGPRALRAVLEEPMQARGYRYESDSIIEAIVDSVSEQPGGLPLLSFAATRLWELRDQERKLITEEAYRQVGGVEGALATYADDTVAAMPSHQQPLLREMFRHLVTELGTRALVLKSEMEELLGGDANARAVIDRLTESRLVVASKSARGDVLEVSHEALLRSWPRLVEWRREDAELLRLRDQLRGAAQQWDERGRAEGLLWRDEALAELRLWRSRYPGRLIAREEEFIAASEAIERRGQRLRKQLTAGAALVLLAGAAVLTVLYLEAREQRARAATLAERAQEDLVRSLLTRTQEALSEGATHRGLAYLDWAIDVGASGDEVDLLATTGLRRLDRQLAKLVSGDRTLGAAAVNASGTRALIGSASAGGDAQLVDVSSGEVLATLESRAAWTVAEWAGAVGYAGSVSGELARFGPEGAALVERLGSGITELTVSPEGDALLVVTARGGFAVYDAASGARRWAREGEVCSGRFVRGKMVAIACAGEPIRIVDAASGSPRFELASEIQGDRQVEVGGDGDTLLVYSNQDRVAEVWQLESRQLRGRLGGHSTPLYHALVSGDGEHLITVGGDGVINVFEAGKLTLVHSLREHTGLVWTVATHGQLALTGGADRSARLWNLETGTAIASFDAHTEVVVSVGFVGSERFFTASSDGTLRLWSMAGIPGASMVAHGVEDATLLDTEAGLLLVPNQGLPRPVDAASGELGAPLFAEAGEPLADVDSFLPLGARRIGAARGALVAAPMAAGAALWRREGEAWQATGRCELADAKVVAAEVAPSEAVFVADETGRIGVCGRPGAAKQVRESLGARAAVMQLALSPDAQILAAAEGSGGVSLLATSDGTLVGKLDVHPLGTSAVSWSEDGRRLASAGFDQRVTIVDTDSLKTVAAISVEAPIARLAWIGRFLVGVSSVGEVLIWSEQGDLVVRRGVPGLSATWAELAGDELVVSTADGRLLRVPMGIDPGAAAELVRTAGCRLSFAIEDSRVKARPAVIPGC